MVSLVNFKFVNEDLTRQEQQQNDNLGRDHMFIKVVTQHQLNQAATYQAANRNTQDVSSQSPSLPIENNDHLSNNNDLISEQPLKTYNCNNNSSPNNNQQAATTEFGKSPHNQATSMIPLNHTKPTQTSVTLFNGPSAPSSYPSQPEQTATSETPNFVVTWRNLKFAIEPKWHQKMLNASPMAAFNKSSPQQQQSVVIGGSNQQQQSVVTKIVLDKLDGSFRSGELTAILGPSAFIIPLLILACPVWIPRGGAGKTTLLDCLTGHRKHGLSGSIKISSTTSPASSVQHNKCHSHHHHHQRHQRYPSTVLTNTTTPNNSNYDSTTKHLISNVARPTTTTTTTTTTIDTTRKSSSKMILAKSTQQKQQHLKANQLPPSGQLVGGDNLKVSIIPQNDHLMGHLTVYETLNYASKMKNCFNRQFDHKHNISRVAQQLGLMSCLNTRINKLSGGQYKRVSIAQELLSNPDILILDEPTSGLDAMTCYQTVQVLRKLADERQSQGQNQIAVILTIHQPNSDVFQQFNHVYVVAHGGKCIYEGPPANIESVINRVGIRLPNSYYNPATMIVEIAAGKFGLDAIYKLNSIQKKQYDFVGMLDEQNSTGDSAVDCPSSSSSSSPSSDTNDDDEDNDEDNSRAAANINDKHQDDNNNCQSIHEINNNNNNNNKLTGIGGIVNKGFVVDQTECDEVNNSERQDSARDVIVVVPMNADADSVDKIKMMNCGHSTDVNEGSRQQRKKRRRTRRRSGEQGANNNNNNNGNTNIVTDLSGQKSNAIAYQETGLIANGGGGGNGGGGSGGSREKRLKLNSLKADQKFPFWRHTYLHFHRSWLSIVRDPMLCSMQLALHIIVPVMVSLVYGTNVGKPNACPRAGPMDIMAYALEPTDTALQLQEDLRTTLENIGYIFFKLYGIIFAAMTVTVLTFPLDMHVLVKEFRNGWYGLSSYFLGRTLADIPFQLTLPLLAMSLSYYATGQPYSFMQWRFLSITAILILSSLIAQSQGLLFGAILMDKMKAAVFVAPAATTPIILFAGFLVRTQSIPRYLRPLSNLSYLRYAIEACLISRYGFNQCECDPAMFNQTVPELPPIARSMLDYWLSSFKLDHDSHNSSSDALLGAIETTTTLASADKPDLFTKLIDSLAKANSFGRNITSCEQVVPYPMIDYDLKDSQLINCFAILLFMLVFTRLLTFFIVCFKVKRKV